MRVQGSLELWREGQINRYLLCTVLAKQTRRLGRLIPEMRIAELIGVAWRNCAEHEVEIRIDGNTPDVIREEAAQMFPSAELSGSLVAICAAALRGSQTGNGISITGQQPGQENGSEEGPNPSRTGAGIHVSVDAGIDSPDPCCSLSGIQRNGSMSHTNGTDRMRQLQLMALAENLYTLGNRHRENGNYIVAHALYGRALEVAQRVDLPAHRENGSALVARIQKERQAVFEMLRSGESGSGGALLEKGQKAGQ